MRLGDVRRILQQADDVGTVEWIYFEGGEPFLYSAVLLKAVRDAATMGFRVGIVTNGYWATDEEDALEWLRPFAGLIQDLSISSDRYHWSETLGEAAGHATLAAERLGIPIGTIRIAQPDAAHAAATVGQLQAGESALMYRGRAADTLAAKTAGHSCGQFTECPHEDLREPGRLHVDPFGYLHVCQGISIGNLFHEPLGDICASYDPEAHPVIGPLLLGGPAELARHHHVACEEPYADACHLCYAVRRALRPRLPESLVPDQMYGVVERW